jgi:non-ribosomal peptide synthetase component F
MELPLLPQQEAIAGSEGGRIYFQIDAGFIKEEMLMRAGKGITEFSVLYAFFLLFVVQLTGQDDTVIGIVTSGRDLQQLEDVVGMFSKTLPVRFRLNPDVSLGELVEAVSKHLVQVYDNQLFDLTDIQAEANRRRETFSGDLFDTMLVYQNYDREQSGEAGKQFVYYEHRHNTAKYPLSLLVTGKDGQWDCLFEYSLAHFHPQDVDRLAGEFSSLVGSACRRFDDPVLEIVQAGTEYTVEEDDISFNI